MTIRNYIVVFLTTLVPTLAWCQMGEELSLESFLSDLGLKHEAHFVYAEEDIKNISIENAPVFNTFNEGVHSICEQHNLEFEFVRPKVVMIREKYDDSDLYEYTGSVRIIDENTNEFLTSALVVSESKNMSFVSDDNGLVQIKAVEDSCFVVHYLGYYEALFCLNDDQEDVQMVRMKIREYEVPMIEIDSRSSFSSQDSRNYLVQKLDKVLLSTAGNSAGVRDPLKGLKTLAGVANFGEQASHFEVRGGKSDENMVRFNGLTLYNVSHYFGMFSNISDQLCDELLLYKDVIPPWYGGYASSVLDIQSNTATGTSSGDIEISNLLLNSRLDFNIASKLSLSMGFRSTIVNLADSDYLAANREQGPVQLIAKVDNQEQLLLDTESTPESNFYDGYASIQYQLSDESNLKANFFISEDQYSNDIRHKRVARQREPVIKVIDDEEWKNMGYGLHWEQKVSENIKQLTQLSYSEHDLSMNKIFKSRDPRESEVEFKENYENSSSINGYRFSSLWDHRINGSTILNYGAEVIAEESDFTAIFKRNRDVQLDTEANQFVLFSGINKRVDAVSFDIGLRANYYDILRKVHWDPRFSVSYNNNEPISFGASYGIVHQFMRKLYFEMPSGRTTEYYTLANGGQIPVLEANQMSFWVQWIGDHIKSRVSVYEKNYEGVVEQAAVVVGTESDGGTTFRNAGYTFLQGTGENIGLEWSNTLYLRNSSFTVNYTLSKNTVNYPTVDMGADIPASNDRRHQLTALYYHELPNSWRFNIQYNFASGLPYTDVSNFSDRPRNRREDTNVLRQDRLRDYHRLDFGIEKEWKLKNQSSLSISANVFNITDRDNLFYEEYYYGVKNNNQDSSLPKNFVLGYEQDLLGITPSLGIRFKW